MTSYSYCAALRALRPGFYPVFREQSGCSPSVVAVVGRCNGIMSNPNANSRNTSSWPLGASPLVQASYRASASALVSIFTAMNTASAAVCFSRRRFWNPESSELPSGIQTHPPREGRYRAILGEWRKSPCDQQQDVGR